MYRESYQRGLLTIFYSCGSKPLKIWETYTQDGYITKFLDEDIRSTVLEIGGTNVSTTYMVCPKGKAVLGITMPFLIMIVKNLKKYFSFEVTILDGTGTRRRFRVSNFQSSTQILPLCTVMPIALSEGWNQIQFNLADFCRRAYQKQFVEVQKFKINANIRIRRIYFADRILPDEDLPAEYKLFIPLKSRVSAKVKDKTTEVPATDENLKKRDSKTLSVTKLVKTESKEVQKPAEVKEEPQIEKVDAATETPAAESETKATEDAQVATEEADPNAAAIPANTVEGAPQAAAEEAPEAEAEGAPEAAAEEEPAEGEAPAAAAEEAPAATLEEEAAEPARQGSTDATTQTKDVIIQEVPETAAPAEEVVENKDVEAAQAE